MHTFSYNHENWYTYVPLHALQDPHTHFCHFTQYTLEKRLQSVNFVVFSSFSLLFAQENQSKPDLSTETAKNAILRVKFKGLASEMYN